MKLSLHRNSEDGSPAAIEARAPHGHEIEPLTRVLLELDGRSGLHGIGLDGHSDSTTGRLCS